DLPVQADRAQRGSIGDLAVGDVVDLQCAGVAVAQDHVGLTKACKIAEACELPIEPDRAQEARGDDVVAAEAIELEATGAGIAQQHGAVAAAGAEAAEPPINSDLSQLVG